MGNLAERADSAWLGLLLSLLSKILFEPIGGTGPFPGSVYLYIISSSGIVPSCFPSWKSFPSVLRPYQRAARREGWRLYCLRNTTTAVFPIAVMGCTAAPSTQWDHRELSWHEKLTKSCLSSKKTCKEGALCPLILHRLSDSLDSGFPSGCIFERWVQAKEFVYS